jgi:hypothetical protein
MPNSADIDLLLQDYLGGKGSQGETEVSSDAHAGDGSHGATSPEAKRAKTSAAAPVALEQMLSRYLDTARGSSDERVFSLPRCIEVDELLRRYVLDQEDVSDRLASSLREHLRRQPEAPNRNSSSQWAPVTAAKLDAASGLDERLQRYAHAYAEQDERLHTFSSADDSTIKGIPPPNAPPIPLGSPLAEEIKRSLTPPTGVKKERRTPPTGVKKER